MSTGDKYLYIMLLHGFTDTLARIQRCLELCSAANRKLLVSFENTPYKISFDDYFVQHDNQIITDPTKIEQIISDPNHSVYPERFNTNRKYLTWDLDMFEQEHDYMVGFEKIYMYEKAELPDDDIIVFWCQGYCWRHRWGAYGYMFLKDITYKPCLTDYAREAYSRIPTPYLCIQIRNTGYTCNFPHLYETNKDLIHSYKQVYIATDYREALDYFRGNGVNVYNFTTFQTTSEEELHSTTSVSGDTKIKDLFMDMYMIIMAEEFISNSVGSFISLCRHLRDNKEHFIQKYAPAATPSTEELSP